MIQIRLGRRLAMLLAALLRFQDQKQARTETA